MSESLRVSNEAVHKEGIVEHLDFHLYGDPHNICPGWDLFLPTLGDDSAFMVCAEDVPDSVHQIFITQACSVDRAMEDFCKEMERGKQLQDGLHGNMHETVKSLWEDTDYLQDDMAKEMVLAWANESTATKMLQSVMSLKATAAALVTAVNDLIPVVWCQGALLQNMQHDHIKFCKEMLPVLTSMVCHCNTTLEELQQDHMKFHQNIMEIHHHVMNPTTMPPSVVLWTTSNVGSGASYISPPTQDTKLVGHNPPRNTVLVGRDDESGALTALCPPTCNNVPSDCNDASGTTNIWYLPPRKPALFGCKGGPVKTREFMSFGHEGGIGCDDKSGAPTALCPPPREYWALDRDNALGTPNVQHLPQHKPVSVGPKG